MIIDDIIEYISENLESTDFESVKVTEAYKYSHKLSDTEIIVQLLEATEYKNDYSGRIVYNQPVQIDIYTKSMKIGNEVCSAQKTSELLMEFLKGILNPDSLKEELSCINVHRYSYRSRFPMEIGSEWYRAIIKFIIQI